MFTPGHVRFQDGKERDTTNSVTRVNVKIPEIRSNRCSFGVVVGVRAQRPLWGTIFVCPPRALAPSLAALTRDVTRPQTAIRHSAHFAFRRRRSPSLSLPLSLAFVSHVVKCAITEGGREGGRRLVPVLTHFKNPIDVVRGLKVKDVYFRAKVPPSIGRKRSKNVSSSLAI